MADIAEEELSILPLTDRSNLEVFISTNDDLNDFLKIPIRSR